MKYVYNIYIFYFYFVLLDKCVASLKIKKNSINAQYTQAWGNAN